MASHEAEISLVNLVSHQQQEKEEVRWEREVEEGEWVSSACSSSSEEDEEDETSSRSSKYFYGQEHERRSSRSSSSLLGLGRKVVGRRSSSSSYSAATTWMEEWRRMFLLVCVMGLFVDPLFFYALSISRAYMNLFVDGWFGLTITILRCMTDGLHLWNMWYNIKLACRRRRSGTHNYPPVIQQPAAASAAAPPSNSTTVNNPLLNTCGGFFSGKWKPSEMFLFDLFVILPLPQIVLWVVTPMMLRGGSSTHVMTVFMVVFLFQYLPKIYHSVCLLRRMQKQSVHIFGTIWWGFALNMIAYFVASHAAGACWYLLGLQRTTNCLIEQCGQMEGCSSNVLASRDPIYYGTSSSSSSLSSRLYLDQVRLAWAANPIARHNCLDSYTNYEYGAYNWVIYLVANENRLEKILMPIFWGLMTMSTFGNLESTAEWVESVFIIIVLTSGLLLVTMLIGNIKVFLHATTSKKQTMQQRMRNMEWWMRKRQLPQGLKQRVRNYEWQRWAAMRGVNECEMVRHLPEGLRRDIKYHLCLDLVRQVPLFQHMDDLVLENICDRVQSVIFTKGETITREGDPVSRMLFVVRGHLRSSQTLRDGVKSCCMLGPGNFSGDELLSWCLRRPFLDRLPPSTATLVTLETTEAFGLDAEDLKYVTQHFRYTFVNEKVRRSARYYSPGWRTWAAVAIQLAWRRYRHRLTLTSLSFIRPRRPRSRSNSLGEDRLRLYTALLTSPKPNHDDFHF